MSKFNRALWNELHNLSSQESELIKRFEVDPTGPAFVAVSDILRKRGYRDESIVILEEGLKKFPQYHSARASLAKDYFQRGLMREALDEIARVIARSPDNLMAQRLRLRLALVFDERSEAIERLGVLRQLSPDDEFTRMVRDRIAADNWSAARTSLFSELDRQGVRGAWNESHEDVGRGPGVVAGSWSSGNTPVSAKESGRSFQQVTHEEEVVSWQLPGALRAAESPTHRASNETRYDPASLRVEEALPFAEFDERTLPSALSSGLTLASVRGDNERYMQLRGFKMVQAPAATKTPDVEKASLAEHGALESTTLAEIYESQGLHVEALEIYEKLVRGKPDNASLQVRADAARERARGQSASSSGATHPAAATGAKEDKLRKLEQLLSRLESLT